MQRRALLQLGFGAGVLLTVAGGTMVWLTGKPSRREGQFEPDVRMFWRAVGSAVLTGVLPEDAQARQIALQDWLRRLEITVAGLPAVVQAELDQLLTILVSAPGRLAFAGLHTAWDLATPEQLLVALQDLRNSKLPVKQQIFHALRDLSNAAYFAAPTSWAALGYPGPVKV